MAARDGLLRARGEADARVAPIELFFDLVYVLAVTQLTHHLATHLTPRGAAETLLLLLAVWTAWMYTAWITSWFDPATLPVRLMLVGVMLASLLMSAAIPEAFDDRGLEFAGAFVFIQVGRTLWVLAVIGRGHELSANFQRVSTWLVGTGAVWLAGGLAEGDARLAIWTLAAVLEVAAVWLGFPVPGLGRSETREWTIAGEHLAERSLLFVIIALGESVIVTGAGFGELPVATATTAAFVVAFAGSVAFWWIYFDRGAELGQEIIASSEDPGRLGRSAYSYFHIPMIAGIIVAAAGDEELIAHPLEPATVETAALLLGGPALYLAGNALFKWSLWEYVPWSRIVALTALAALVPVALVASALVLAACATGVLAALAARDTWLARRPGFRHPAPRSATARPGG
jgi:low temperature requirement protein LtrA